MKVKIGDKLLVLNSYGGYEVRIINSIGNKTVMAHMPDFPKINIRTSLQYTKILNPEYEAELNSIKELEDNIRIRKQVLIESLPKATLTEDMEGK